MQSSILIVEDDPIQRRLLEAQVTRAGHRALTASGGEEALRELSGPAGHSISLVLLDLLMPNGGGMSVMDALRRSGSGVPVLVQTAKGSVDSVVAAMRAGAVDYLVKPVPPERLQEKIVAALKVGSMAHVQRMPVPLDPRSASPALAPLVRTAAKAASSTIPILIGGETGTGKEWLARAIHAAGRRSKMPFVAVNCGAVPADLVESLLFGHQRGAFTGAADAHPGKFAEADGGTLFLDEVGELPPAMQVKLLRALQEGEIDPVGSRKARHVDVRVISATNRDLRQAIAERRFREDLYYRLNALELVMPPLRRRRDEIAALARSFAREHGARELGRADVTIGDDALALLAGYDWPGNVRQLENQVHRAVVLADGAHLTARDFAPIAQMIDADPGPWNASPADLGGDAVRGHAGAIEDIERPAAPGAEVAVRDEIGHFRTIDAVEADLIRAALSHYGGRISEVARRLGIGRSTLYRKMRGYGIES